MFQSTFYSASSSMSMSNPLSIARLGFYLCILGLVAAQLESKGITCQANGEYCQMHSECCSRKCMTYMNVCARRIDEGFPVAMPPPFNSIYEHVVKQPANQFPDIVEVVTLATEKQGPQCNPVGGPCYASEQCCTKRCHSYMHRCVT